ncbi:MAG: DUF3667 domain-containing protein [Bacteroidetes bacterium]|nr:DUF3667 domain-containing protein [Bacteroidota bacterium]
MENKTPILHCRNCQHPLTEPARYCPNCGQKNHDGRLTFREMMEESVVTIFNFDNRIFSTLKALAIPGKLTVDYFNGIHIRYYHPVRLFLVSAALFITMLSIRVEGSDFKWFGDELRKKKELHQKHLMFVQLDSLRKATASEFQDRQASAALDTLLAKLDSSYNSPEHDSIELAKNFNFGEKKDTVLEQGNVKFTVDETQNMKIAVDDIENMEGDKLLETYKVEGFWKRLLVRQQVRMHKKGDNFGLYLIGNTLWMMLVMMPMLAVVLKLLYVRRRFFYYEHLIFSFHAHSFMFLFFMLLLLVSNLLGEAFGPVVGLSITAAAFYPMFAMKRFYRQGWFKSIAKFFLVSFLYLFIFLFAFIGMAIASFALF